MPRARWRNSFAALLFLVASIAGCVTDSPPEAGVAHRREPTVVVEALRAVACSPCQVLGAVACSRCFEPTVAVRPEGTIVVATADGPELHVSNDAGASWTVRAKPPAPFGSSPLRSLDGLVTFGPDGRLWYIAIAIPEATYSAPAVGVYTTSGIQVAVSADDGETWSPNHDLRFPNEFVDRPWITFGPDATVYLSWKSLSCEPAGCSASMQGAPTLSLESTLFVARSDDGGATFGERQPVHAETNRGIVAGPPSAHDGTFVMPYFSVDGKGEGTLRVARSTDGGRSFEQVDVWVPPEGIPGDQLPMAAVDPDGAFHLAWVGPDDGILYAASYDAGATWSAPVSVPTFDRHGDVAPWIEADGEGVRIAAFGAYSEGTHLDVVALRTDAAGPPALQWNVRGASLPAGVSATDVTDFATLALAPSGDALVAWTDPDAKELRISRAFARAE